MFVSHTQLNLKGRSFWYKDLEDKELMHYIQAGVDSDLFGARAASIMKIGRHLLDGVRWQLDFLTGQCEDVSF